MFKTLLEFCSCLFICTTVVLYFCLDGYVDGGLGSVWNAICDNVSNLICSVSFVARQNRFDRTSFQTQIIDLSHDGRGLHDLMAREVR